MDRSPPANRGDDPEPVVSQNTDGVPVYTSIMNVFLVACTIHRLRAALLVTLLLPALYYPARADVTIRYAKTDATLVLFGQPQEASFIGDVGASVQLSGTRVRVDAVDLFGKPWHIMGDRMTGAGFVVDSTERTFRPVDIGWRCEDLPVHTARWLAHFMRQANADSVRVSRARSSTHNGLPARELDIYFRARLFGAPQPARSKLILVVPADEQAAYGEATVDLYCGAKPPLEDWSGALHTECAIALDAAEELASVVTLPYRITIETDMGIGQARVVLDAVHTSFDRLPPELFDPPGDFALPQPVE